MRDRHSTERWKEIQSLFIAQQQDDKLGIFTGSSDSELLVPEFTDYEDAGLEESRQQPLFGNTDIPMRADPCIGNYEGSVTQYCDWIYDGENPHWEI